MPNYIHNSTVAMILNNGNFVLCKRLDPSIILWQSFDDPTDTWIPGAKLGFDTPLRSWKFSDDPARGNYLATVEKLGETVHSMYLKRLDLETQEQLSVPITEEIYNFLNFDYVSIQGSSYFVYSAQRPNTLKRFVLDSSGQFQLFSWEKSSKKWDLLWAKPTLCGAFSAYNRQSVPTCVCLEGFIPNMSETGGQPQGCIRRIPLGCERRREDKFIIVMSETRLLDTPASIATAAENITECELACLRNCSCIAYAYDNYNCLIWKGNTPQLGTLSPLDGMSTVTRKRIHVRVAASEDTKRKGTWIATSIVIGASIVILTLICVAFRKTKQRKSYNELEAVGGSLVLFKYRDLNIATKKFSEKLGEGGFGLVFRGKLPNSTSMAVKQLKGSRECEKQFLAEVKTLGEIQHINLVRLRGFCAEASNRFLVYDYMPNGSLASLLFQNRDDILNWRTIYHIAVGTARGIAYLHEKCIDCIIHCDIKPENVLLDAEYNPKVADFGLAKLIGRDFSRVLTTMRGTRGYLAPEWMSGLPISSKADVYSYGKLLFELLSRKRNMGTLASNDISNYFPYRVADALNKGEDILSLLDYSLGDIDIEELTRACKVASWCIQDDEKDRPSMGEVVNILEGLIEIDTPPIPTYFQCLAEDPVKATFYLETSTSLLSSSY
ncbi:hypothetical protein REPUB_Repub13aG0064400 [Reevesia pubescens]